MSPILDAIDAEITLLKVQLEKLEQARQLFITRDGTAPSPPPDKKKRRMSAAGRARISAAAKKRWAQMKKKSPRRKAKAKLHWTQRPENREKVKQMAADRIAKRKANTAA